jgi:hypothetical protein
LLDPALTSNGTHPNSIPDALREAATNGSNHPSNESLSLSLSVVDQSFFSLQLVDDGIARGNDALTLLENRQTYTLFIHELHRVCDRSTPFATT